jgi:hypothetical protein
MFWNATSNGQGVGMTLLDRPKTWKVRWIDEDCADPVCVEVVSKDLRRYMEAIMMMIMNFNVVPSSLKLNNFHGAPSRFVSNRKLREKRF